MFIVEKCAQRPAAGALPCQEAVVPRWLIYLIAALVILILVILIVEHVAFHVH